MQTACSHPSPISVYASPPPRSLEFGRSVSNPPRPWRKLAKPGRLTVFLWIYVAQAVAGSVIGFAAPFLYYFGVL
jgi:hypothetical protein